MLLVVAGKEGKVLFYSSARRLPVVAAVMNSIERVTSVLSQQQRRKAGYGCPFYSSPLPPARAVLRRYAIEVDHDHERNALW